jgi:hypothetical protein
MMGMIIITRFRVSKLLRDSICDRKSKGMGASSQPRYEARDTFAHSHWNVLWAKQSFAQALDSLASCWFSAMFC